MSESAAFRILDAAWSIGVRAFDTAEAYGVSAQRLRAWTDARKNAETIEIVTKCSVDRDDVRDTLKERACNALSRFKGISSVTLLTHGAVATDLWNVVLDESTRHHAAAGQSVYSPDEVAAACALPGVNRVQAPGNVLDLRAIEARGSASVPLDVRSVYLQGILLEIPAEAEQRVPGAAGITAALQAAAAALDTNLASLLIASTLKLVRRGDRLVIGFDNVSQLDVLPAVFEIPDDTVEEFRARATHLADDPALSILLDPRSWPAPPPG